VRKRVNTTPQSSLNKPSLPPRWSAVNWEVWLLPWWLAWTNHWKVMSCFHWAIYEEETYRKNVVMLPWYLVRIFSWNFWGIIHNYSKLYGSKSTTIVWKSIQVQRNLCFRLRFKCLSAEHWLSYWVHFAVKQAFSLHVWSATFLVKCHYNVTFMG